MKGPLEQYYEMRREEMRREGIKEDRKEGINEGLKKGLQEGRLKGIKSVINTLKEIDAPQEVIDQYIETTRNIQYH